MSLTPAYGTNKQINYRLEVLSRLSETYKVFDFNVLTLGGAYCLENPISIERQLIDNGVKELCIVENDFRSVKKILKSLGVIEKTIGSHVRIFTGKFKSCQVTVIYGSLYSYLKYCEKNDIKYQVVIADYYCTINFKNEQDLRLLNSVLSENSSIFWTSPMPRRELKTAAVRRILRYDTNKNNNYISGAKVFFKARLNVKRKIENIKHWIYDNKDINPYSYEMIVFHCKVA